jgi:hypothetical protein
MQTEARAWFESKKHFCRQTASVRERIIRLNPNPETGKIVRGYFRKPISWRRVKRCLQRGGFVPDGCFKTRGGQIQYGWEVGPVNLYIAKKLGWLK